MEIRKIENQDAFDVAKIHIDGWKHAYKNILPASYFESLNYEKRKSMWENIIKDDKTKTFVITDNKQIIGYISGMFENDTYKLFGLYIVPEFIGKGIGSKLFDYVEKNFNFQKIGLMVFEGNNLGIDFYLKKGFEFSGKKELLKINNDAFNTFEMIKVYTV